MNTPPRVAAWGTLLIVSALAGAACRARPAQAAVVVLANRSEQQIDLWAKLSSGQSGQTVLPPGRLITLPVGEAVEIAYDTGKRKRRETLNLNTLYYFEQQRGELALRPIVFSRSSGVPWMHVDLSGRIPPPVTVPVKVLVDEEQPGRRAVWEQDLKNQIELVSRIFEQYCRVRFEVVAADTWDSDDSSKRFDQLLEEFRREVSPDPARLAIGFSSQLKIDHPNQIPSPFLKPLSTHLLMAGTQKKFSDSEQIVVLAHQLGHFLGAVESQDKHSVMFHRFLQARHDLLKEGVGFDPPNTLAMNLLAEELRQREVRDLAEVPRSTRKYLYAIYMHVNPHHLSEAFQTAMLFYDGPSRRARYTATWTDGTQASADGVEGWHDTESQPKLAGRALFGGEPTVRWLLDNTLAPPDPPDAAVEMFGGDCLPGRVIGFSSGAQSAGLRGHPHLRVHPRLPLDWPDAAPRPHHQVLARWVRRIVWQRVAPRYAPSSVFFRDGRRVAFRSLRLAEAGVRILTEDGVREIAVDEMAELHFPQRDPWDVHFEQLAVLAPAGEQRLIQIETADGLRATTSQARFQAKARGSAKDPKNWYHLVQPAWSLLPMWIRHEDVRLRCFFQAHEVPLSRIDPVAERQRSDLGGVWPARIDRNAEGGGLASGGRDYAWGFGVHARTELEFPLHDCAISLRCRLGLDQVIGDGGCVLASIHLGSAGSKPLYQSPLIIGSTDSHDTGELNLARKPGAPARLVLRVDDAHKQRPKGADPLDIRDHFDWLEPRVLLDPQRLEAETARRAPSAVAAWQDWEIEHEALRGPMLVSTWDRESPESERAYHAHVCMRGVPLMLSRKLWVTPEKCRLLVTVGRPREATASRVEVRVDGERVEEFEVPVRYGSRPCPSKSISLAEHAGGEVKVEIVQQSPDERSLVRWEAISLVAPAANDDEKEGD